MSFQTLFTSLKKEKGKKVIVAVSALALLAGGVLAVQNGQVLLADVLNFDKLQFITPLMNEAAPTTLPIIDKGIFADQGTGFTVRKLVAIGSGPFVDANDESTAPDVDGTEVRYLIHVGNPDLTEHVDDFGNHILGNYIRSSIEDQFPAQIVDYGRHVTCWTDENANSEVPPTTSTFRGYIFSDCSYSRESERFFYARTTITPDLFPITAGFYVHILVSGNYVPASTILHLSSQPTICNTVTASARYDDGRAFDTASDSACIHDNQTFILAPEVRTPRPEVSRPKPIPEPEFQKTMPVNEGN